MPSPVITDLATLSQGEQRAQVTEGRAHKAMAAQLQRVIENVRDYERSKSLREQLADRVSRRAAEMSQDPDESVRLAKQMFAEHSGKINQAMDAQRRALEVAFEQGAWELPETIRPEPDQAELISKNRPVKLTRMQALTTLMKEQGDVDQKIDVLVGRLSPEQQQRLEALQTEEHFNPFQERGWLERTIGKLGAFGSAGSAAATGLLGYAREQTKDVPLEEPEDPGIFSQKNLEMVRRVLPTSLKLPMLAAEYMTGSGRVMGVPVAEAASRILSDPEKLKEAAQRTTESWAAGFGDSSAMSLEREAGQAQQLYEENARAAVERRMPHASPTEKQKEVDRLAEAYLAQDFGRFGIEHPILTQIGIETVTDPMSIVPLGTAAKLVSKATGLTKLAGAAAKTAPAMRAAEAVRQSTAAQAAVALKSKFTYMPGMQRFRRLGAEKAEEFADTAEMIAAKTSTAATKRSQEALALLKQVKKAPDQKLLFDLLDMEPDQAAALIAKHGAPPQLQQAYEAGRKLSDFLYSEMRETGLSRNWHRLAETTRRPLTGLKRREQRLLGQLLKSAPEDVDVGSLSATMQKAYKAAQELPPNLQAELAKGQGLSQRFLAGEFLGDISARKAYVPKLLSEAGEDLKVAAPSIPGAARPRMLASGAHARRGDTAPLRDAYKQFERKLQDELPKARKAQQIKQTVQAAEASGFVVRAVPEKADEMVEALNKADPGMEWVKIDAPGPRHNQLLEMASGESHMGLDEIVQRLAGEVGTKKGLQQVIVPREIYETLHTLAPAIPSKSQRAISDMTKAVGSVIIPMNTFWRYAQTIPNFAFSTRNLISSVGLHSMSHGLAAFNPATVGKSMAASFMAASGSPKARKALSKIKWRTLDGNTTDMGWIAKQAEELGLIQNMEKQALEAVGTAEGITSLPLRGLDLIAGFGGETIAGKFNPLYLASPKYLATATENYQHLMSFAAFLEGTSPHQIAKAFRLASKATANYAQVGAWERGLLRHTLGFYGWNRFILPMMAKKLFTDTARVNAWARTIGGVQRWFGKDSPYSYKGESQWVNWGIHREKIGNRIPQVGTHEYALGVIENPLSFGYGFLPAVAKSFGLNMQEGPEMWQMLGPLVHFGIEAVTGRDLMSGEQLPPIYKPSELPSNLQRILWQTVKRPVSQITDIRDLYFRDARRYDKALDLDLRYRVGRTFLGLDNIIASAMGAEGRSMGGMLDPASGGVPFMMQYPTNIIEQGARKMREASGTRIPRMVSKRRQALPSFMFEEDMDE